MKRPSRKPRPRDPKTLADLTPDPQNARRHTERNLDTIGDSFDAVGPGRSIVIDEAGVILAGNATVQVAKAKRMKLRVVDTDADTLIGRAAPRPHAGPEDAARALRQSRGRTGRVG
jgi:hypothetical protein